jgi:hypothetical protein
MSRICGALQKADSQELRRHRNFDARGVPLLRKRWHSGSGSDPSTGSAEGGSDLARSIAAMVHSPGSEASKRLLKPIHGRRSRRRVDSWFPAGLLSAPRLDLDRGRGALTCLARASLTCCSNCSINLTGAKKVACTQSSGGRISSHAAVTCRSIEYTRCRLTPYAAASSRTFSPSSSRRFAISRVWPLNWRVRSSNANAASSNLTASLAARPA